MTTSELRAMFVPGQQWRTTVREADESHPPQEQVQSVEHHAANVLVLSAADGAKHHVALPRGSEIVEERDGYLRFCTGRYEFTLERME
ncbi:MAG: hypothetical protein AzoDbin1_04759 [Azoarcus sp.]|nr:hypothetical protein [Azoarcus sp.]